MHHHLTFGGLSALSDLLDGKIAIMLKSEAGKQKEFVIFTDYNAKRMDICLRDGAACACLLLLRHTLYITI